MCCGNESVTTTVYDNDPRVTRTGERFDVETEGFRFTVRHNDELAWVVSWSGSDVVLEMNGGQHAYGLSHADQALCILLGEPEAAARRSLMLIGPDGP